MSIVASVSRIVVPLLLTLCVGAHAGKAESPYTNTVALDEHPCRVLR